MKTFAPGDRVVIKGGMVGRVLEVREGKVIVDGPDGPVAHNRCAVRHCNARRRPSGITTVGERELEAARQVNIGVRPNIVASRMGISLDLLHDWLRRVREATQDRHLLAAMHE